MRTVAIWFSVTARWSGVMPVTVVAPISAPEAINIVTICGLLTAEWSGLNPIWSCASMLARPFLTSKSAKSFRPISAAKWRAVCLCRPSVALTSHPALINSRTRGASTPSLTAWCSRVSSCCEDWTLQSAPRLNNNSTTDRQFRLTANCRAVWPLLLERQYQLAPELIQKVACSGEWHTNALRSQLDFDSEQKILDCHLIWFDFIIFLNSHLDNLNEFTCVVGITGKISRRISGIFFSVVGHVFGA